MLAGLLGPLAWLARPKLIAWNNERFLRNELRYQVLENLSEANQAIDQHAWATAQVSIDRARLAAASDPTLFTPNEISAFDRRFDSVQLRLNTVSSHYSKDPDFLAWPPRCTVVRVRTDAVSDLLNTTVDLLHEHRYSEAQMTVDQILILDPESKPGLALRLLCSKHLQHIHSP